MRENPTRFLRSRREKRDYEDEDEQTGTWRCGTQRTRKALHNHRPEAGTRLAAILAVGRRGCMQGLFIKGPSMCLCCCSIVAGYMRSSVLQNFPNDLRLGRRSKRHRSRDSLTRIVLMPWTSELFCGTSTQTKPACEHKLPQPSFSLAPAVGAWIEKRERDKKRKP